MNGAVDLKEQTEEKAPDSAARRLAKFAPLVLALFFAAWGLRGISNPNPPSDACNHLLNGVFLADALRNGKLGDIVSYARDYYGRLPALTMPFHPPLFPAIEAVFFLGLGASVITARILIALAVFVSVWLFVRLVLDSGGSRAFAYCSAACVFSMAVFTGLASNVMLEFPTLAFALAALYQLRRINSGYRLRQGLLFALFAGAAVWTKQQAVFLGLVPFFYIAVARRWRLLASPALWVSSAIFGAASFAYASLTAVTSGAGGVREIPDRTYIVATMSSRLMWYVRELASEFGVISLIWILAAFVFFLVWRTSDRNKDASTDLMLAWAPAAFAVLFLTGHLDRRYLFFVYAPLVALGVRALLQVGEFVLGRGRAWVPAATAAAFAVATIPWNAPNRFLKGPAEAAAMIVDGTPKRILYCGSIGAGNFVIATRFLDPAMRTIVFRADKLGQNLTPEFVEEFAHKYGVNAIVLPKAGIAQPCDALAGEPAPSMSLERELPLVASGRNSNGVVGIYRFSRPSASPERALRINVPKIGGALDVRLDQ